MFVHIADLYGQRCTQLSKQEADVQITEEKTEKQKIHSLKTQHPRSSCSICAINVVVTCFVGQQAKHLKVRANSANSTENVENLTSSFTVLLLFPMKQLFFTSLCPLCLPSLSVFFFPKQTNKQGQNHYGD